MLEINQGYNTPGASSQGDDVDISPEIIEKLLRRVPNEPLKHVEDVVLPDPFPLRIRRKHTKRRRGPKSIKDWTSEVRRVWGYLEDEKKLSESWLALLPPVQKLAASSYGGRAIGSGLVLQEFLNKALIEALTCPPKTIPIIISQKGGKINGQKGIYTGTDHQDDLVTSTTSSTGIDPVIPTLWPSIQILMFL